MVGTSSDLPQATAALRAAFGDVRKTGDHHGFINHAESCWLITSNIHIFLCWLVYVNVLLNINITWLMLVTIPDQQ